MVRRTSKCDDCRRAKTLCMPTTRCWKEGGQKDKCDRCLRIGHNCSAPKLPGDNTTQGQPADTGIMASATQAEAELHISGIQGVYTAEENLPSTDIRLKGHLKTELQELDKLRKVFEEIQLRVETLAKQQNQLHAEHPYKVLLEHERLINYQNVIEPRLQEKLTAVVLLAEQLAQKKDTDAAEKAYLRVLQSYRSLALDKSRAYTELLKKVITFYFNNDDHILVEEYLEELLQRPDIQGSTTTDLWRQMAGSLKKSSEELKTAFLSIATEHETELGLATPFPPLHRMIRMGYNHTIQEDLVKMGIAFDVDIISSPPIHSAIATGRAGISDMIDRCSDVELESRDVYDRTPMFLAVLCQNEAAGEALLERFSRPSSSDRRHLRLDDRDFMGWTILAIAILTGCSSPFIERLIDNNAEVNPLVYQSTNSPLQAAVRRGRQDVELYLVARGANRDDAGLDHNPTQPAQHGPYQNFGDSLLFDLTF